MKRIGLLSTIGALALAVSFPSATSAAYPPPYRTRLLKAVCTNENGKDGFGKLILGMRAYAVNYIEVLPTPNYIVLVNRRQEKIDDAWVTVAKSTVTSQVYPDGSPQFYATLQESFHFQTADHPRTRMIMRAEFWDDLPGGDIRLETMTERTDGC